MTTILASGAPFTALLLAVFALAVIGIMVGRRERNTTDNVGVGSHVGSAYRSPERQRFWEEYAEATSLEGLLDSMFRGEQTFRLDLSLEAQMERLRFRMERGKA